MFASSLFTWQAVFLPILSSFFFPPKKGSFFRAMRANPALGRWINKISKARKGSRLIKPSKEAVVQETLVIYRGGQRQTIQTCSFWLWFPVTIHDLILANLRVSRVLSGGLCGFSPIKLIEGGAAPHHTAKKERLSQPPQKTHLFLTSSQIPWGWLSCFPRNAQLLGFASAKGIFETKNRQACNLLQRVERVKTSHLGILLMRTGRKT